MEFGLKGRHVAILAADGVEESQLQAPRKALSDAGMAADVVAAREGEVKTAAGKAVSVDRTFEICHAADYDALVIPGGRAAADALASDQRALQLVREFMAADKPVAAIAEGVRLLVAADTVAGRAVAGGTDLGRELEGAGGQLVDAPLHIDEKLITSRGSDLEGLSAALVREFANRVDEARVDQLSEQSFPASDPPPGPVAVGGGGASTTLHLDPRGSERGRESDESRPGP